MAEQGGEGDEGGFFEVGGGGVGDGEVEVWLFGVLGGAASMSDDCVAVGPVWPAKSSAKEAEAAVDMMALLRSIYFVSALWHRY